MAKGVIVACDVSTLEELKNLVIATRGIKNIRGYKLGAVLAIKYGLMKASHVIVEDALEWGHECSIIYDHQKAATDIPEMGDKVATICRDAGIYYVIIFPMSGPETQQRWTESLISKGIRVIVGGHMTHPKFLVSEGGYIADEAPEKIFNLAIDQGVRHFVVPGNKPEFVKKYRELFEKLGLGKFTLMAPGFITQGGDISETGKVAGDNWYAIVGSAIYKAGSIDEMRKAATKIVSQIL